MPKLKSNKGVLKRFRLTKKGKVKRSRAFKSHILTKKNRKRKRGLRRGGIVSSADSKRIKRLLR